MQFIKNIKVIGFFAFVLLFSLPAISQEVVDDNAEVVTDTSSVKKERKFKLFSFLKKKKKKDVEELENMADEKDDDNDGFTDDLDENNDSTKVKKKKRSFFSFLKRKNKSDSISNDSINADSISSVTDSIETKERFSFFKKKKKGSKDGPTKPDRIRMRSWNNMSAEQQDSVFKAWDSYDKEFYKKRYAFTKKEVTIALKIKRNFLERQIYKRARKKPEKKLRKLINRQNRRYQKTIRYERFKKNTDSPNDSISDKRKYRIVNKQYKRGAKREAIRKNKVVLKYDRKENRLRRRYELSDKELYTLNKGKGIRLRGKEKVIFKRARRKQEKFSEKLIELRRKRNFALQSKTVQARMKKDQKRVKKRDKEHYNNLHKKKKKKKKYKKHDSDEYPKRYH